MILFYDNVLTYSSPPKIYIHPYFWVGEKGAAPSSQQGAKPWEWNLERKRGKEERLLERN
jgi:hypothetical protein